MEPIKRYYANINGQKAFYVDKNRNQKADKGEVYSNIDDLACSQVDASKLESVIYNSQNLNWIEVVGIEDIKAVINDLNVYVPDSIVEKLFDSLESHEVINKQKVCDFLVVVTRIAGESTDVAYEYIADVINALKSICSIDSNKMIGILEKVTDFAGEDIDWAYKEMPGALQALNEAGIDAPVDVLISIGEVVGEDAGLVYKHLPLVLSSMRSAGITDQGMIRDVLNIIAGAGKNTGWVFRVFPETIKAICEVGIDEPSNIVMILSTLSRASGEHAGLVYERLPDAVEFMVAAGVTDPQKITDILISLAENSGKFTFRAYEALPDLLEAGIDETDRIIAVLNSVSKAAGGDLNETYSSFSGIIKNQKQMFSHDYHGGLMKLESLIKFATRSPQCVVENMATIFSSDILRLDFSDFEISSTDLEGFAVYLADCLNALSKEEKQSLDTGFYSQLAVLINNVHESDVAITGSDGFRETLCRNLDADSVYFLLARGGKDLYTSTFNKLNSNSSFTAMITDLDGYLSGLINVPDKEGFLSVTDDVMGLMLTLFQFRKVELISNSASIVDVMVSALSENDEEEIMTSTAFIVSGVRRMGVLGAHYSKLSNYLLEQYDLVKDKNTTRAGCIKYLIKQLALQLSSVDDSNCLETIAESLPSLTIKSNIPREKWLGNDNTLTAKLYFYSDEKWFQITQDYYIRSGYTVDKDYMSKNDLDQENYAVFSRVENGVTFRVILTNSEDDDRESAINSDDIDIIVHRGHSYHLKETFPEYIDVIANDKLIFGGSCGSYRDMVSSEFLSAYQNNYFIADQNTGQGAVNNRLLNTLMKKTARGEVTWEDILPGQEESGIVLPNDPAFLLNQYLLNLTS